MIEVALLGAGRLGVAQATHLAQLSAVRLVSVYDPDGRAAEALARRHGAEALTDPEPIWMDSAITAVVITAPAFLRPGFLLAAAQSGKAVLTEVPLGLDLLQVDEVLNEVERAGIPVCAGFRRRFDPRISALKTAAVRGEVGRIHMISIVTREAHPPDRAQLERSGGLFRDLTVHDLDVARWLLGEDPVRIHAFGAAQQSDLVRSMGDVDTASIGLETASGAMAQIFNARHSSSGPDYRIEIFGETGSLSVHLGGQLGLVRSSADGLHTQRNPDTHASKEAYRRMLGHFVDVVMDGTQALLVGPYDARQAMGLAEAAVQSKATHQVVSTDPFRRRTWSEIENEQNR